MRNFCRFDIVRRTWWGFWTTVVRGQGMKIFDLLSAFLLMRVFDHPELAVVRFCFQPCLEVYCLLLGILQ